MSTKPIIRTRVKQFASFFLLLGVISSSILLLILTYRSLPNNIYRIYLTATVAFFLVSIISFFSYLLWPKEQRTNTTLENIAFEADENETPTDHLIRVINLSYLEFKRSTSYTFRNVRIYKYSAVIISTLATITLGISYTGILSVAEIGEFSTVSKNIALVLSTIVTALTTLSSFWNIDKFWIQNKVIKHQLRLLLSEVKFERQKSRVISEDKLKEYFSRYQSILKEFYLYWEGVLTERKDTIEQKNGTPKDAHAISDKH